MITLGHIISEAGLDSKKYPRSSEILVELYDRKNRKVGEGEFRFNGRLFEKNPRSKSKFVHMIDDCEGERKNLPNQISARINDDSLIIYFPYRVPLFLSLS